MARLTQQMRDILSRERPMTVRQMFYQLVSLGLIEKTERAYKGQVVRQLTDARLSGVIPFRWITDNTRWMRKPTTYAGMQDALERMAEYYRRDVWADQDVYVEIWLEKDALSGVLYQVTREWDVPLMVTRGYPSLSFLHEAAATIERERKPTYLYYFGDYDPSGVDIPRTVFQRLREFAPDADITFEPIAVTPEQISDMGLPTRPTKQSDSRSANFAGGSVEVDAIPPNTLRTLVRECILRHISEDTLRAIHDVEHTERETLRNLLDEGFGDGEGADG